MAGQGKISRRVFHIYLPDADRLACDAPATEVEVVVAEPAWEMIETTRLCTDCVRTVQARVGQGALQLPTASVYGHRIIPS